MAASSQVSQNKRGRDEYLNNGLAPPEAKRINSGMLGYDSDLIALLDKIDNMDNNEQTDAVNEAGGEMILDGVIKSLQDEIGLKAQTANGFDFESINEKRSTVQSDIGEFTNYEDIRSDLDFFEDHITTDEFAIIMQNYLDGDSVPDIAYSEAVHGYVDSTDASYGFLWEDDICLLMKEHPTIPNDFRSPQQEEFGISGAEFHDVWN